MKYNFKKISAIGSSLLLAGMSVAAPIAAANYPAPFVVSGNADVSAIVYGANAATLDGVLAGQVNEDLNAYVTTGSSGMDASISGEAVALFTGGTKLYINDSLNVVKNVLTKSDLPTVLKDESFSGIVDATITQTITMGSSPRIVFAKQPTNEDNPQYGFQLSTSSANYIYNATATFSKAMDFTNSSSEGEEITLFGQKFTIASATNSANLVLLKSAEKISLNTQSNPSADVTIGGEDYTVELVSASTTTATIKVTDSSGSSDTREISEAASRKINGLTVAVQTADANNFALTATIIAGSEKVTLSDGADVTVGDNDESIEGAQVTLVGGTTALTKLVISVVVGDSDQDALLAGETFTDPVFGSFKIDFSGFNIAEDAEGSRETFEIFNSGDDKMEITFTDHSLNKKTITFAKNTTGQFKLFADDENRNFSVLELEILKRNDYVVVGNEDEGHLLKLTTSDNVTTGYGNDKAWFTDVFTGDVLKTTWENDGTGTLYVAGKGYTVLMSGDSTVSNDDFNVTLNYPDSTGTGVGIIYPTIQTSKGANLFFYEPMTINISLWDGTNPLTELKFPDGDGYTSVTLAGLLGSASEANYTIAVAGTDAGTLQTGTATSTIALTIGELTYELAGTAAMNTTTISLRDVGSAAITGPAIVIFQEKDDNNNYEALIVKLENGVDSEDGIGVYDVESTWWDDYDTWAKTMPGDSKTKKEGNLWGTIITTDTSDSDQTSVSISYPDEQMYAQVYVAEDSASITAGASGSAGGSSFGYVVVSDSEAASMASKNMIIVGGTCINSAAAKVLGVTAGTCGAAFTSATGVGSGQFLIESVADAYTVGKIAVVVAGYEVAQTQMATTYLTTKKPDLAGGNKYIGTSSTSATLQTTAA